jgi:hypothetical protein
MPTVAEKTLRSVGIWPDTVPKSLLYHMFCGVLIRDGGNELQLSELKRVRESPPHAQLNSS